MTASMEDIIKQYAGTGPTVTRRTFVKATGSSSVATALAAFASKTAAAPSLPFTADYGPLSPVADQATGLPLIALPEGFTYTSYGWTGQRKSDGNYTPTDHDGMEIAAARGNTIAIVRNYESSRNEGNASWVGAAANNVNGTAIDKDGRAPTALGGGNYDPYEWGGTGNLLFDVVQGRFLADWNSLGGTIRNCAVGGTPWGTVLSCEETFHSWRDDAGQQGENFMNFDPTGPNQMQHGYVFEVPGFGVSDGKPIREMGRFSHEAAGTDPQTGIVYMTEDSNPSGFYRFIPAGGYGDLKSGGTLQCAIFDNPTGGAEIQVPGEPAPRVDTRDGSAAGYPQGTVFNVTWVTINDPDAKSISCFEQAQSAAIIERGEGCYFDGGYCFFVSTSGGADDEGQVFKYDPRSETCEIILEGTKSQNDLYTGAQQLDGPDNIAVSPRGGLLLCEDGSSNPKRLIGVSQDGTLFSFAENLVNLSPADMDTIDAVYPGAKQFSHDGPGNFTSREWCGACFYGRWLFVNIQSPGITFAITGPWEKGAL